MAFIDAVKEAITQKPANLKRPHFYKADSDAIRQLEQLKEINKIAPDAIKPQIEQDIKMLSYGIAGEESIAFELNNSSLPVIVLHDLHIVYEDLSAQIDYLIITNKFTLVIECKNLIGNIEVNSNGDFIRTLQYNGKYKKEGIYSPITQNMRHLEMIRKVRLARKNNFLTQTLFEKYFDENYKSVVVLANPKTVVNMKYAKKDVKEKIIRCDQLIEYIKRQLNESKTPISSEKEMYELADFFLNLHSENTMDYTKKYKIEETGQNTCAATDAKIEDTPLYKQLKQYRYDTSKAEGVKAYYIFSNAQLEKLVTVKPKTLDELKTISGFGDVKSQKYGPAILEIIRKET
ncbi:MAG: helicase [Syntrophomonadaceae bacterium]|nr:helicase [Syntrophomonadaceae bacterium]